MKLLNVLGDRQMTIVEIAAALGITPSTTSTDVRSSNKPVWSGPCVSRMARAARSAAGRGSMFWRGSSGALYTRTQTTPNGGWSAESQIGSYMTDPQLM